jgi:hypothetical protein
LATVGTSGKSPRPPRRQPPGHARPPAPPDPNTPDPNTPDPNTLDPALSAKLLREALLNLYPLDGQSEAAQALRVEATVAALAGIDARDPAEAMLAAQMVATHDTAMQCLARAARPGQSAQVCEAATRQAVRLMSLYGRQIDTLDRHRGHGRTTVQVGHVQIEPGAQAIVGQVTGIRHQESGISRPASGTTGSSTPSSDA